MRIFLIAIFIFLASASYLYALMPLEGGRSEDDNSRASQIIDEKRNIMESIAPVRKEREKSFHPFVQETMEGPKSAFDYTAKANAPVKSEKEVSSIKAVVSDAKPGAIVNFVFILTILTAFLLSYFFIRPKSK